jgi:hypothetical protein
LFATFGCGGGCKAHISWIFAVAGEALGVDIVRLESENLEGLQCKKMKSYYACRCPLAREFMINQELLV